MHFVGLTSRWLLFLSGEWVILFKRVGIGPTLMLIPWALYMLILIFEGKLFKAIFRGEAQRDTAKAFFRLTVFHWLYPA